MNKKSQNSNNTNAVRTDFLLSSRTIEKTFVIGLIICITILLGFFVPIESYTKSCGVDSANVRKDLILGESLESLKGSSTNPTGVCSGAGTTYKLYIL